MPETLHLAEADAVEAWHFLPLDRRLWGGGAAAGRTPVEAGSVLRVAPPARVCGRGLHGSRRAADALHHAPGPVVCRTRHWGAVSLLPDKFCSEYRAVAWMADAEAALLAFGCDCAEEAAGLIEADKAAIGAGAAFAGLVAEIRELAGIRRAGGRAYAAANGAANYPGDPRPEGVLWALREPLAHNVARYAASALGSWRAWAGAEAGRGLPRPGETVFGDLSYQSKLVRVRDYYDGRLTRLLESLRPAD